VDGIALSDLAARWAASTSAHLADDSDIPASARLLSWLTARSGETGDPDLIPGDIAAGLAGAHLTATVRLIATADYSLADARRLHAVAAMLARTAGGLVFAQGRHAAAQRYWLAAFLAAHTARRPGLAGAVLCDLACQFIWLRDPGTAIQLLAHVAAGHRPVPVRAAGRTPAGCSQLLADAIEHRDQDSKADIASLLCGLTGGEAAMAVPARLRLVTAVTAADG
jgi:hypothetical protein